MKNYFTPAIAFVLLAFAVISLGNSSGAAASQQRGYTGAPSAGGGTEGLCGNCHNGGTYGEPVIDYVVSETLGGEPITEYRPGQNYFVTVNISGNVPTSDALAAYGFQTVFLNQPATGAAQSVGTLFMPNDETQISATGAMNGNRVYAEQQGPSSDGQFAFSWQAPAIGTGNVEIWAVGNVVNGLGTRSGDNGTDTPLTIVIPEAEALPIALSHFDGTATKDGNSLSWVTASEEAFSHFELQTNLPGRGWATIARINGRGDQSATTAYEYTDEDITAGQTTYRLRMVDLDGSFTFSDIVNLRTNRSRISIYPNPATDFVQLTGPDLTAGIRVLNGAGTLMYRGYTDRVDVRAFPAGIYYIESFDGATRLIEKFVKR